MKTIGIIGAMEEEVASLKTKMEIIITKNIVETDFYMGKMLGKNVVLVRSGIGKVNAAVCAQILIDMYGVDYIINIGVAGAISKELNIGDIVVSTDLVHHDFLIPGKDPGEIPMIYNGVFAADYQLIQSALEAGSAIEHVGVVQGRIVSGDQFVSSVETKARIWKEFKALCTEMEGAAIAQVCSLNKIPFIVIRSISDKADDGAGIDFDAFMVESAKNSSTLVEELIKLI